jgi:mono/diheme cytochrome c family protein
MRERLAVAISMLAITILVGLSVLFAARQNPATARAPLPVAATQATAAEGAALTTPAAEHPVQQPGATPDLAAQPNDSLAGLQVYQKSGCARCHSVAGTGNPRNPLDGTGSRRTPAELRAWTTGAKAVEDSLSPSALRAKRAYAQMPEAEMRALVAYLTLLVAR